MTKLYVFTGFLGSGKTTLLSELMRKLEDKRIGVIQNEIGKLGIDSEILKRDGIEMVEINRGSIFCTCLKLHFVEALAEMAEKEFDYLFVESSGIGDPSNVEEILQVLREAKGKEYDFAGLICLVDALHFLHQLENEPTVERQVKHCHMAVISKIDLVDDLQVEKVEKAIREINPVCRIEKAVAGDLPSEFLADDLMRYKWAESEESLNSAETKPKTLILRVKEPVSKEAFEEFISKVSDKLYRVKGFMQIENEGLRQVDIVGNKIDYKPCERDENSELTLISKVGTAIIKPVFTEWKSTVKTEMELKN